MSLLLITSHRAADCELARGLAVEQHEVGRLRGSQRCIKQGVMCTSTSSSRFPPQQRRRRRRRRGCCVVHCVHAGAHLHGTPHRVRGPRQGEEIRGVSPRRDAYVVKSKLCAGRTAASWNRQHTVPTERSNQRAANGPDCVPWPWLAVGPVWARALSGLAVENAQPLPFCSNGELQQPPQAHRIVVGMECAPPGRAIQWKHHDCPDVGDLVAVCAWNAPQFCSAAVPTRKIR